MDSYRGGFDEKMVKIRGENKKEYYTEIQNKHSVYRRNTAMLYACDGNVKEYEKIIK